MSQFTALSSSDESIASSSVNVFAPQSSKNRPNLKVIVGSLLVVSVLAIVGFTANTILNKPGISPAQASMPAPQTTPQVASATFGDLLKQAINYQDWLAGLNEGRVELVNPGSGQLIELAGAKNIWYGPISQLYWSPDKSKIAAIYMPDKDAAAFTDNPQGHAETLGLDIDISPTSFPYGLLTIIDLATKQRQSTTLEVKNSPKSIVWLDNNQLAFINSSLNLYNIQTQTPSQLTSAGHTSPQQQLASPLVWNSFNQSLYFTRTKRLDNQTAYLLSSVSLADSTVSDQTQIQLDQLETEAYQLFDMAISPNGQRMALINQQGLAYINLPDGAIHQLPYQDSLLWLKQVSVSQMAWLSDHRLVFSGLTVDGQRLWGGWDTEQQLVPAYARGSLHGTWHAASGQLAIIDSKQDQLHIVSPDWVDPTKSHQKSLDLSWTAVYW